MQKTEELKTVGGVTHIHTDSLVNITNIINIINIINKTSLLP